MKCVKKKIEREGRRTTNTLSNVVHPNPPISSLTFFTMRNSPSFISLDLSHLISLSHSLPLPFITTSWPLLFTEPPPLPPYSLFLRFTFSCLPRFLNLPLSLSLSLVHAKLSLSAMGIFLLAAGSSSFRCTILHLASYL